MLVSEIDVLRNYWYAIARSDDASTANPRKIKLFGDDYVLWHPNDGAPVLTQPYCPHRGAGLDAATVCVDRLVCCYHGWEWDPSGTCLRIPQLEDGLPIPRKASLQTWPVVEKYGLYWTCVGKPVADGPPDWYEADELGWHVQVDFFEPWKTSALRIIDNNIDQSHPAFVHQGTFGDPTQPLVPLYDIDKTDVGFKARIVHEVKGVGPQMGIVDEKQRFERVSEVELFDPVHTRILLAYNGLASDYCFYGSATPIDDEHSIYVRVSALASDEAAQPYAMFHEYSRRVILEDKVVLETTNPEFTFDITSEVHLKCDKTTIEFRRLLGRLAQNDAAIAELSVKMQDAGLRAAR